MDKPGLPSDVRRFMFQLLQMELQNVEGDEQVAIVEYALDYIKKLPSLPPLTPGRGSSGESYPGYMNSLQVERFKERRRKGK